MPTGDSLSVLLTIGSLAIGCGVAAYSLTGAKARNLWIVTAVFAVAAVAYGLSPSSIGISPERLWQYVLALIPLVTISTVAILVRERLPTPTGLEGGDDKMKRRRSLISAGRSLATRFTNGEGRDQTWRHFLEGSGLYPIIRPHLSDTYLKALTAPRTAYASPEGSKYEALVQWFLDDLDRLEREWDLA